MQRRGFLQLLGGTVAGIALEQAIPFGRVWSFPSEIIIPNQLLTIEFITRETLVILRRSLKFNSKLQRPYDLELRLLEEMRPQLVQPVQRLHAPIRVTTITGLP